MILRCCLKTMLFGVVAASTLMAAAAEMPADATELQVSPAMRAIVEDVVANHKDRLRAMEHQDEEWRDLLWVTNRAIEEAFAGGVRGPDVEYYWSQFGRHGCEVDVLLVMAAPGMLHSGNGSFIEVDWPDDASIQQFPVAYRMQVLGSEVQARTFLKDRDVLRRYHRLILWAETPYGRPDQHWVRFERVARRCHDLFEHGGEDAYWVAARDFVLLAYATGREDLLDHFGVDRLDMAFEAWLKWYVGNLPWIVANEETMRWELSDQVQPEQEGLLPGLPLPSRPCDDWPEDIPLPDGRVLNETFL